MVSNAVSQVASHVNVALTIVFPAKQGGDDKGMDEIQT